MLLYRKGEHCWSTCMHSIIIDNINIFLKISHKSKYILTHFTTILFTSFIPLDLITLTSFYQTHLNARKGTHNLSAWGYFLPTQTSGSSVGLNPSKQSQRYAFLVLTHRALVHRLGNRRHSFRLYSEISHSSRYWSMKMSK